MTFRSSNQFLVTTTAGHQLLYSITDAASLSSKRGNSAYVLPGGEKGNKAWPKGPGEGRDVEGIIIRSDGERGMNVGDGVAW